jgi:hypothetical protein
MNKVINSMVQLFKNLLIDYIEWIQNDWFYYKGHVILMHFTIILYAPVVLALIAFYIFLVIKTYGILLLITIAIFLFYCNLDKIKAWAEKEKETKTRKIV